MNATVTSVKETVNERLEPVLDCLEEDVRTARRNIAKGRRAVEDCLDATTVRVRRRPLPSIAVAIGVGAVAGCLMGWAFRGAVGSRMKRA